MRFIVSTASTGYSPAADSAESMTASAPSKTAMATSETSARVGTGAEIMLSSICVATTTGLPTRRAARVNLFLHAGHRLERHLHAEIAARHHDGVRQLHDLVDPLQRLRLLDLGHDAGAALDDLAGLGDVLGALDEGERHPVDVLRQHGVEVAPVLVGERARADQRVGQADALAVGELSALQRPRSRRGRRPTSTTLQADAAVVEQHGVAGLQGGQGFRGGEAARAR